MNNDKIILSPHFFQRNSDIIKKYILCKNPNINNINQIIFFENMYKPSKLPFQYKYISNNGEIMLDKIEIKELIEHYNKN